MCREKNFSLDRMPSAFSFYILMPRGFDGNVTIKETINALLSKITGQWKGRTAGGCANNRETWPDNPRFKLVIDSPSQIQVS